jgi:hypothetical protein
VVFQELVEGLIRLLEIVQVLKSESVGRAVDGVEFELFGPFHEDPSNCLERDNWASGLFFFYSPYHVSSRERR